MHSLLRQSSSLRSCGTRIECMTLPSFFVSGRWGTAREEGQGH